MTVSILDSFLALLELALVGRLVLSLLPAGHVGSHRLHDLPTTWAASHMLGLAVADTFSGWTGPLSRHFGIHVPHAAWLLAWVLILLGRALTLPGGIVPGRSVVQERSSVWSRAVWVLTVILIAAFVRNPSGAPDVAFAVEFNGKLIDRMGVDWATVLATCVLVDFGLKGARRAPLGRVLVVLACVGVSIACGAAAALAEASPTALPLASGAAFLIVWLRRADRRALQLAVIGLATCSTIWLSASALAVLVLSTPRPSRRQALAWSAGMLAAVHLRSIAELFAGGSQHVDFANLLANATTVAKVTRTLPWILFAIAAATCAALALAEFAGGERRPRIRPGLPDPPTQEVRAVGWLLASSALIVFVRLCLQGSVVTEFEMGPELAQFAFLIALFAGLVLVRTERVESGSAA